MVATHPPFLNVTFRQVGLSFLHRSRNSKIRYRKINTCSKFAHLLGMAAAPRLCFDQSEENAHAKDRFQWIFAVRAP